MTQPLGILPHRRDETFFSIASANRRPIEGHAGSEVWDLPKIEAALVPELQLRRRMSDRNQIPRDGLTAMTWLKNACYQVISETIQLFS